MDHRRRSPRFPGHLLWVALFALGASVGCSGAPSPAIVAFVDVGVVDIAGGRSLEGMTVLVEGDRITAMGPSQQVPVPRGARRVAGEGGFLLPGLWDMHVHLEPQGFEAAFPLLVANGVLGVRDMGGDGERLRSLRQAVREGQLLGPELVVSGRMLDGPTPDWPFRITVAEAEEAATAVAGRIEAGNDFIKVHQQLSREAYLAIADAANEEGMSFAGHVPVTLTAAEAATAGQHSLEHLTGMPLCSPNEEGRCANPALPDLFDTLRRERCWQSPTLIVHTRLSFLEEVMAQENDLLRFLRPETQAFWDLQIEANGQLPPPPVRQTWLEGNRAMLRSLAEAEVGLLAGTDLGFLYTFPGFSLHEELELWVEAGVSAAAVLRAATLGPAVFLGREDDLGTVEAGKIADLLFLEADPLEDIRHLSRIRAVIARGELLDRELLDGLLASAEVSSSEPQP